MHAIFFCHAYQKGYKRYITLRSQRTDYEYSRWENRDIWQDRICCNCLCQRTFWMSCASVTRVPDRCPTSGIPADSAISVSAELQSIYTRRSHSYVLLPFIHCRQGWQVTWPGLSPLSQGDFHGTTSISYPQGLGGGGICQDPTNRNQEV